MRGWKPCSASASTAAVQASQARRPGRSCRPPRRRRSSRREVAELLLARLRAGDERVRAVRPVAVAADAQVHQDGVARLDRPVDRAAGVAQRPRARAGDELPAQEPARPRRSTAAITPPITSSSFAPGWASSSNASCPASAAAAAPRRSSISRCVFTRRARGGSGGRRRAGAPEELRHGRRQRPAIDGDDAVTDLGEQVRTAARNSPSESTASKWPNVGNSRVSSARLRSSARALYVLARGARCGRPLSRERASARTRRPRRRRSGAARRSRSRSRRPRSSRGVRRRRPRP